MSDEKQDKPTCPLAGQDVLSPGPSLPNGDRLCLRHTADHEIVLGALIPAEDGRPLPDDAHMVYEEEGQLKVGPSVAELKAGSGPAQVATNAYRESWDRIFGKPKVGLA